MLRSQLVRGEQHDDGGDEGEQDASATLGRVAAVRVARLHAARVVEALELEVTAVADAHDFCVSCQRPRIESARSDNHRLRVVFSSVSDDFDAVVGWKETLPTFFESPTWVVVVRDRSRLALLGGGLQRAIERVLARPIVSIERTADEATNAHGSWKSYK